MKVPRYLPRAALLLLSLLLTTQALAGDLPGRRMDRPFIGPPASPAFGRQTLPPFETQNDSGTASPPQEEPEAPLPQGQGELLPGVYIREIRLVGNHALSDAELRAIADAYQGRWVSVLELHELRQKLSLLYYQKGYINSGALIPDQEISDGVVVVQVIEGTLGEIRIIGNQHLSDSFLRARIEPGAQPPLNLYRLGERLQLLQSHPLIRSLSSELKPGVQLGEADLDVLVRERDPHRMLFDLSNAHSPSVGEATLGGEFTHLSLTGRGDQLSLRMEADKGLKNFALSYVLPLTAQDTLLGIQLERDNDTVISEPFQDLDIQGERSVGVVSLSHPLVNGLDRQLLLSGGLEVEQDSSTLGGEPFSFVPWAEEGKARVALIYFGQDWILRQPRQVLALRSTFKLGLDAFGSTVRDEGPDSRFFSWLGQVRWAKRLKGGQQLILRSDLQLSADPLMTMEQYALGGLDNVRGYRTNELVRDNAFFASAEYRLPLGEQGEERLQRLDLALFADFGHGWNRGRPSIKEVHSIYSLGLGLVWDRSPLLRAELYWGIPLREVEHLGYSIQDEGIHFRVVLDTTALGGS